MIWERTTGVNASSLLPTSTAQSYGSNIGGAEGRVGKVRLSLNSMASQGLWPTPTVNGNNNRRELSERAGDGLGTAVKRATGKLWATPMARDWKGGRSRKQNTRPLSEQVGETEAGPLNPAWVEALMGFPAGWVELPAAPGAKGGKTASRARPTGSGKGKRRSAR